MMTMTRIRNAESTFQNISGLRSCNDCRVRPKTTGSGQPMVVRMHGRQISAIDAWIAVQGEDVSRPEAIGRLVDAALERGKNRRP